MNWLYLANYSHSCDALSCFSMYRRGTFHHSSSFLSDVFFSFSFKVKDLPAPHLSRHPFKHVQLQEHLFCGNCTCLQGTQLTFNHFCWTWIPYCPYLYFYFFFKPLLSVSFWLPGQRSVPFTSAGAKSGEHGSSVRVCPSDEHHPPHWPHNPAEWVGFPPSHCF